MFILDHSFRSFGFQPGGAMVLPCMKEAYHYRVIVVENKATYLTAAGRQTKGPNYYSPISPQRVPCD